MSTEPPRAEAIKGAHKPFVPAEVSQRELTVKAVALGAILGVLFALSSVYLGLKVGLTVSASIPIAVLAITVFRWMRLKSTILENNIVQTTGSAGESIAAGVAFTLPSLLIMGFELELMRILLVALLGGLIGVLMMIPLRHGLIVKEHGKLAYPEGTACADVLIVGEKGGTEAKTVFLGFFVGLGYAFLNLVAKLWADASTFALDKWSSFFPKKATVGFEVSPPMLGVGYIIGPKVAANMIGGGLLAFAVLIPLIVEFGGSAVAGMSPGQIRNEYILYIGAGAVATGGFIALARSIPTIVSAFRRSMGSLGGAKKEAIPRTEQDLPMTIVLGGAAAIAVAIFVAPVLDIDLMTSLLVVLFGFFFVTVSSRITGEIGSSSNPISGMTIATLLLTCGLFVLLGRTGVGFKAMALTTAALVCVAASNGGTISQDLKTGFLVGATPKYQQIAILVGVVTSAIAIGVTLLLLNDGVTTYQVVDHAGFQITQSRDGIVVSGDKQDGPDKKSYKVAYVQSDSIKTSSGTPIPRGKYLVDEGGNVAFFVHPGVVGTYPYKLKPSQGAFPAVAVGQDGSLYTDGTAVGREEAKAIDPDKKERRAIALDAAVGDVQPGRYLVGDDGTLLFKQEAGMYVPIAEGSAGPIPGNLARAADGTLKLGKSAVGTSGGTDLGFDRKPYSAYDLTEVVGNLRPGRYLVADTNQIAYYSEPVSKYDAPKAQLFRLIIDGTLGETLPWGLVFIGVVIAIILELLSVQSLPFAVGLYLPIHTSGGIFVGGLVRHLVDRKRKGESAAQSEFSPGMLMASGLIAGGAILGVIQSILFTAEDRGVLDMSIFDLSGVLPDSLLVNHSWYPMIPFLVMAGALYWVGTNKRVPSDVPPAKIVTDKTS
jgi:putative OPT family oligopeptide transporter